MACGCVCAMRSWCSAPRTRHRQTCADSHRPGDRRRRDVHGRLAACCRRCRIADRREASGHPDHRSRRRSGRRRILVRHDRARHPRAAPRWYHRGRDNAHAGARQGRPVPARDGRRRWGRAQRHRAERPGWRGRPRICRRRDADGRRLRAERASRQRRASGGEQWRPGSAWPGSGPQSVERDHARRPAGHAGQYAPRLRAGPGDGRAAGRPGRILARRRKRAWRCERYAWGSSAAGGVARGSGGPAARRPVRVARGARRYGTGRPAPGSAGDAIRSGRKASGTGRGAVCSGWPASRADRSRWTAPRTALGPGGPGWTGRPGGTVLGPGRAAGARAGRCGTTPGRRGIRRSESAGRGTGSSGSGSSGTGSSGTGSSGTGSSGTGSSGSSGHRTRSIRTAGRGTVAGGLAAGSRRGAGRTTAAGVRARDRRRFGRDAGAGTHRV